MKPSSFVREIPITDIPGLRIGHAQNEEAKTGVTVLIFDQGAAGGVDISGGGPASRETPLTSPVTADNPLNAIVLSGGSAFGLAAGDGVMRYLEEHGMGYPTGFANVPLVCQSCIYDLGMGRADVRPDAAMGYEACVQAENWVKNASVQETFSCAADFNKSLCGSIGAGCGASVGKICGMERSMKSGIGICAVSARQPENGRCCSIECSGRYFQSGNRGKNCRSSGSGKKALLRYLRRALPLQPADGSLYGRRKTFLIQYHHRSNHYQWKILQSPVNKNRFHDPVRLCPVY